MMTFEEAKQELLLHTKPNSKIQLEALNILEAHQTRGFCPSRVKITCSKCNQTTDCVRWTSKTNQLVDTWGYIEDDYLKKPICAKCEGKEYIDDTFMPKNSAEMHERTAAAFDGLKWLASGQFRLQSTNTSRMHKLLNMLEITEKNNPFFSDQRKHSQSFLIRHNWAAAFSGDKEFEDKTSAYCAPAPHCCFEFTISNRTVLALMSETAIQNTLNSNRKISAYFSLTNNDFWLPCNPDAFDTYFSDSPYLKEAKIKALVLRELIWRNIKAACVALEAEVAETELIRTPYKLNAARERRGKPPLPDHHVINLANRRRYELVPEGLRGDKRQGPRLHFRRSHIRHYANYTVKIKWCLVGNPDLGFIDKDYRL